MGTYYLSLKGRKLAAAKISLINSLEVMGILSEEASLFSKGQL